MVSPLSVLLGLDPCVNCVHNREWLTHAKHELGACVTGQTSEILEGIMSGGVWYISSLRGPHISWFLTRNYSAHPSVTGLYQPLLLPPPECGKVTTTTPRAYKS